MKKSLFASTLLASLLLTLAPHLGHAQEVDEEMVEEPMLPEAPKTSKTSMKKLFKVLKSEPKIKEVQKWALHHYKLHPERINSMSANARLKGLVPEIDLSFSNTQGNTFNNTRDGLFPILPSPAQNPNPDNLKERAAGTSSSNYMQVRAVWNLDRLVFNAEGLDVMTLSSLGETLVREVSTLYYSRRRLLASIMLSPPEDPEELFYELTRLDEITSTIDALTGGRFSKTSWQWGDEMVGL